MVERSVIPVLPLDAGLRTAGRFDVHMTQSAASGGPSRFRLCASLSIFAAAVFLSLTMLISRSSALVGWDRRISHLAVDHRTASMSSVAKITTQLGSGWAVIPIVIGAFALLMHHRRRVEAALLVASSLGTSGLVQLLKWNIGRSRPPSAQRLMHADGFAFPSGHSAQSIACYAALGVIVAGSARSSAVRKAAYVAAVAIALAVGWSRVYLGVHWATDVLGGWLLACTWLLALLAGREWTRSLTAKGGTLLSGPNALQRQRR